MKTNYEIRYAAHPEDAKHYDTARIRRDFLIEKVFSDNEVNIVYSMYDRMVVGGARPVGEVLKLEAIEPLKAPYFLTRREMGIFNVGGPGMVRAGDAVFELDYKEALYLGAGDREVTFESKDACLPAKFYFNSTTAHRNYPDKKITKADAIVAETGSLEGSNHRCINKMLVSQVLPTCQLQMGMTELKPGSVWNTMPAHVHSRRMEAYFYFEVPGGFPKVLIVNWLKLICSTFVRFYYAFKIAFFVKAIFESSSPFLLKSFLNIYFPEKHSFLHVYSPPLL